MNRILKKNIFDEVTDPQDLFEGEELIAISHAYYAQFPARHIDLRKICLSLYDKGDLSLVAHFDRGRYPINAVAFHPTRKQLLIGTGSYDGGYLYEGELILWDYGCATHVSLLKECREVIACRFIGDSIEFTLNPEDDSNEGQILFNDETYRISGRCAFPVSLSECEKIATVPHHDTLFDETARAALIGRLNDYATAHGKTYRVTAMAWDMLFVDADTLCVGLSGAVVEIWDISRMQCRRVVLAERGVCAQVFYDQKRHALVAVVISNHYQDKEKSSVFRIDLASLRAEQLVTGSMMLSQNRHGAFFGRQIDYIGKKEKDRIFDSDLVCAIKRRFGHYDLFNHYIRIDGEDMFYAVLGTPENQHKNKKLVAIDTDGHIVKRYAIDPAKGHFMNLNAVAFDERFVVQAKVYDSSLDRQKYVMFAINRMNGVEEWRIAVPAQATALCVSDDARCVIAAFANGALTIFDAASGKALHTLAKNNSFGIPLSLARHGQTLAVGYDDGCVELMTLSL